LNKVDQSCLLKALRSFIKDADQGHSSPFCQNNLKMSFCRSSKLRSGKNISVTFTSDEDMTDLDDLPILELIENERQEETIDILTLLEMEDAREELGKSFLDLQQV
jgi:hypothetical protein